MREFAGLKIRPSGLLRVLKTRLATSQRLRLFRLMVGSEPGLLVGMVTWMLVSAVTPILTLVLMARVVGAVPSATAHGFASSEGRRLVGSLIAFGVLFAISLAMGPIQTALQMVARVRLTFHMQERLMLAVNHPHGMAHLEEPKVLNQIELAQGSLMSYFPADAPMTLATVVSAEIQGAIACVIIGSFRWWMGLGLAALWLGVRGPLNAMSRGNARSYTGNANVMRRALYFNELATTPLAAKELRIFGLSDWIIDGVGRRWAKGMEGSLRHNRRFMLRFGAIGVPATAFYLGCCVFIGHVAYSGHLRITALVLLLTMLPNSRMIAAISPANYSLIWMLSGLPYLDEVEESCKIADTNNAGVSLATDLPRQSIRFDSVSFNYPGSSAMVFDDLSLEIPAGRSTAIVGVNGAGKTTLVKLLTRLHQPTNGRILVDGIDLQSIDPASWQRRVATLFQDFNHYPLSARENIQFGSIEHADDISGMRDVAEKSGALSFIESLENGWDTVLSKDFTGGAELSGGQWQRVALARALFAAKHTSGVLVLDEPTASLDVRGEADIYEQFLEMTRGLTTVIISHRFSTVRLADHICVIASGKLIEEGSHEELLASHGTYATMFLSQAARFVDSAESSEAP